MNTKQNTKSTERPIVIRRVILASAVHRFHGDIARHKKAKKALRRMPKEKDI